MAQDLFVFTLGGDDGPPIDVERAKAILAVDATAPRYDVDLHYVDGSGCLEPPFADEDDTDDRSLKFRRFGGRIMMERLFALAEALDVVLVWTDTYGDDPCACVVGADKLPRVSDEIRTIFKPVEARDPRHLNRIVMGTDTDTW